MNSPALLRIIWLLGGLALLLGFSRELLLDLMPRPRALPRADGAVGQPWFSGEFISPAQMQELADGRLPSHIPRISSWVGEDAWQGKAESAWFKANRAIIHVGIAGYPRAPGCNVWAEFRDAAGRVTRIHCPLVNPREQWGVWEIWTPSNAIAVRIVGEDNTSAYAGWVAFSHPFRAWPGAVTAAFQGFQLLATAALAMTLVWGPGLLWVRRATAPEMRLPLLLGAGPLILGFTGIAVWCLSGWARPQLAGLLGVFTMWAGLGIAGRRCAFTLNVSDSMRRMVAVSVLIVVAVIAKSAYSVGPQGELYRGTVSRNMEMSDRIDSRFSFYVVQAAAHHWGPASSETEKFFAPWTFFSRGPLAGLIATPVVMATNGRPPTTLPESRWSPFDVTGFAAYRITLIVLSASVVMALFLTLVPLVGDHWAAIAGGLLALTPFGVHEMMFTWPKWPATAWLLASFGLAHARRPLASGVALGFGFLFHPLALLWTPWLALWAAGRAERRMGAFIATGFRFGFGVAALAAPWMALGALMPHLPTTPLAGQAGFFRYWLMADWKIATWGTWWQTRWMNFANTFVPLHLCLSDSFNHPKLSSAYEASDIWVKSSELWWNTLPFGMGLGLWGLSLAALGKALRTLTAAVILFVIAPALLITAYWGMDPLGLMRECGHPLFVAIIAIVCVVAAANGGKLRTLLLHTAVPWLQLPETWLMLWLTTFLNRSPSATDFRHFDSVYFGINAAALVGVAWILSRERIATRAGGSDFLP